MTIMYTTVPLFLAPLSDACIDESVTMQVRVVKEKGDLLVLHISHTHVDFVNGLRRSILNHVPTAAISTVHVLENQSVMADEFLSHRLGLVPLACPADPATDVAARSAAGKRRVANEPSISPCAKTGASDPPTP